MTAEPDRIDVPLGRVTLHALCWGPADGPLVIALHGYPDTAWTWRWLGPALAGHGYRVVAPFLPGYHPSTVATDGRYATGAIVGDLLELQRALAPTGTAALIGHDWGAVVAHALTGAHPAAFPRAVTVAVPPLPALGSRVAALRHGDLGVLRQLRASWYAVVNLVPGLAERLLWRMVPLLWRQWSPGYDAREDLEHLRAALPDRDHRTAALRYYRHFASPGTVRYAAAGPGVPTLYLHGVRDGCLRDEVAVDAEEHLPPGSRVHHLRGVGHFLHLEDPGRVHELVLDFLGR